MKLIVVGKLKGISARALTDNFKVNSTPKFRKKLDLPKKRFPSLKIGYSEFVASFEKYPSQTISNLKFFTSIAFLILTTSLLPFGSFAQRTETMLLSGLDKDHTVDWDFYCTSGRNSRKWTRIPVPSNWELHGFGHYNHGTEKNKSEEKGIYKHEFQVKPDWKMKKVFIVFEGSMTDTKVKINGKLAGPVHQGGYYRFKYEIGPLLKYGTKNMLEVEVAKASTDSSVNQAERETDNWVFGGIFRPVYLEVVPEIFIKQVLVISSEQNPKQYLASCELSGMAAGFTSNAQLLDSKFKRIGKPVEGEFEKEGQSVGFKFYPNEEYSSIQIWNPENPVLYWVEFTLEKDGRPYHKVLQRFGFRKVDFREKDGFYLDGTKVRFKGVNYHTFWPDAGRCSSKERSIADVLLMKSMNMNAVRMNSFPPDPHFLEVCDSLGLFVVEELAGSRKNYSAEAGKKLVNEMVIRDVNHPSIVAWGNRDVQGSGTQLDDEFTQLDPQFRTVIHPGSIRNNIDAQHYKDFGCCIGSQMHGHHVWMPTEFLHGLYDGGLGAGLEDYWTKMRNDPLCAGGFLFELADEGVVRKDRHDSLDVKSGISSNGIVGPYHEKEASYYAIQDIWSPIDVQLSTGFREYSLAFTNNFLFTDLKGFEVQIFGLKWEFFSEDDDLEKIVPYPIDTFSITSCLPGRSVWMDFRLFSTMENGKTRRIKDFDQSPNYYRKVLVRIFDTNKNLVIEKTIRSRPFVNSHFSNCIIHEDVLINPFIFRNQDSFQTLITQTDSVIVSKGKPEIEVWNKKSGKLMYTGPDLAEGNTNSTSFESHWDPKFQGRYVFKWKGKENLVEQTISFNIADSAFHFDVSYLAKGSQPFAGVTFDWKPEKIDSVEWVGNGPNRVWQNRRRGVNFGYWKKAFNETKTGLNWNYPEWAGYHEDVRWCRFKTTSGTLLLVMEDTDLFVRWGTPKWPVSGSGFIQPPFPPGDLSVLHSIPPVGNKMQSADGTGPQGQQNFISIDSHPEPIHLRFWLRTEP